jgi:hypothetical protein
LPLHQWLVCSRFGGRTGFCCHDSITEMF